MTDAPLIEAVDACIRVDGVSTLEGLRFRTEGARGLVLGAPRALFRVATGFIQLERGVFLVRGQPSACAIERGELASAPYDPPLRKEWTLEAYVYWSARLAGQSTDAKKLAHDALGALNLRAHSSVRLARAPVSIRRAASMAAALATGARTIFFEDPTADLDDDSAARLAASVVEALANRAWVLFAAHMHPSSPFWQAADHVTVLSGSDVVESAAPAEILGRVRSYALDVLGDVSRLAADFESRGARTEARGAHIKVALAEGMTTRDLFELAHAADATILRVYPLASAFA